MFEILPVFFISIALSFFSEMFSQKDRQGYGYIKREPVIYWIMAIILVFFVGLRTRYNDTSNYIESYTYLIKETGSIFDSVHGGKINWFSFGQNPGFNFIQNILKHRGATNQTFLMFFAVITIISFAWFVKKYATDVLFSVYLMFTLGVVVDSCAAIKQFTAMAIGMIAIDRFFKKKYFAAIILIFIGMTMHPYIIMFAVAPFLMFTPWTKKTVYLLLVMGLIGVSLKLMLGTIIDITSMLGEEYDTNSFSGEGINPFRVAVMMMPILLSYIVRDEIAMLNDKKLNLFINFSMLNGMIMFIGLFGTANYFGRLANYFLLFEVITIPILINMLNPKYRGVVKFSAIICYFLFFAYESYYGGFMKFDLAYDRVTLKEFFNNMFV